MPRDPTALVDLDQLIEAHDGKVSPVWRYFQLRDMHPSAIRRLADRLQGCEKGQQTALTRDTVLRWFEELPLVRDVYLHGLKNCMERVLAIQKRLPSLMYQRPCLPRKNVVESSGAC